MAAASSTPGTDPRYDTSLPPAQPQLHAARQALKDVARPEYWRSLCPGLHVCDDAAQLAARCQPLAPPQQRLQDLKQQINTHGVAQVDAQECVWDANLEVVADAVVTLVRHGWPPSFILMYDEVWAMVQQASLLMAEATGGNRVNMDILAWLVDPNRGDAGFSPHRDRQPDDAPSTFRPDGSAMYATLWVPLTHATPENSCLYVIPRGADPGYFAGDPDDDDAPDPLSAALHDKQAYQHIRALPAAPGSALLFTHRTIHWGSRGRRGCPTPRISLSWGCADDAYEAPYFSREHLPCPPLSLRLALVGAQQIIYHERFPAPPRQLRLYYEAFTAEAHQFDASYRAKVKREMVGASKEATAGSNGAAAGPPAAPTPAAAAPGAAGGSSRRARVQAGAAAPKKEQQKAASAAVRKRGAASAQAKAAAAAAAGSKRRKAAAPATAAAGDVDESSDGDEGPGIDFAALAAAARARGGGSSGPAAAAAAAGGDAAGSDDEDVLDLALECMLDGDEDDFQDDYEDE